MNATPKALEAEYAELAIQTQQETQALATETTLLNPRFYTTDFDEMDAIDVTPVREDWDKMIAAMAADPNKGHFKKNDTWDHVNSYCYFSCITSRVITQGIRP